MKVIEANAKDFIHLDPRLEADWGKFNLSKPDKWPFFVLLDDDKTALGFAFYWVNSVTKESNLLQITVLESFRKRGFGSLLLSNSLELLRFKGVAKVFLEVDTENYSALSLYLKLNFKKLTVKKDFYGSGRNAWSMMIDFGS